MKTQRFHYRVKADVAFTPGEVAQLLRLSASHYDARCRRASFHGGFLYGIENARKWNANPETDLCECTLSFGNIDLLAKITEMEHLEPCGPRLHGALVQLLYGMSQESGRINAGASDDPIDTAPRSR